MLSSRQSRSSSGASEDGYTIMGNVFRVDARYKDLKAIGKGSYGVVCSAVDVKRRKKVAIKKITPMAQHAADAKHVLREIRLMRYLGVHPNVISLEDVFVRERSDELYIVMELLDSDLHRIIQSPQALSDAHHRYFMYQLLRGVKFLHDNRIIHRDLKPGNLLVTKNCQLKITDFGLARARPTGAGPDPDDAVDEPMTEHVVTRWYRPPELMLCPDGLYTYAVDMWSVGCIFAELLGRQPLFPGKNFVDQLTLIFDVVGSPREEEVSHIRNSQALKFLDSMVGKPRVPCATLFPEASEPAISLLDQLLVFHPPQRLTVHEALDHPYFDPLRSTDLRRDPLVSADLEFDFETQEMARLHLKLLILQEVDSFRREQRHRDRQAYAALAAAAAVGGNGSGGGEPLFAHGGSGNGNIRDGDAGGGGYGRGNGSGSGAENGGGNCSGRLSRSNSESSGTSAGTAAAGTAPLPAPAATVRAPSNGARGPTAAEAATVKAGGGGRAPVWQRLEDQQQQQPQQQQQQQYQQLQYQQQYQQQQRAPRGQPLHHQQQQQDVATMDADSPPPRSSSTEERMVPQSPLSPEGDAAAAAVVNNEEDVATTAMAAAAATATVSAATRSSRRRLAPEHGTADCMSDGGPPYAVGGNGAGNVNHGNENGNDGGAIEHMRALGRAVHGATAAEADIASLMEARRLARVASAAAADADADAAAVAMGGAGAGGPNGMCAASGGGGGTDMVQSPPAPAHGGMPGGGGGPHDAEALRELDDRMCSLQMRHKRGVEDPSKDNPGIFASLWRGGRR